MLKGKLGSSVGQKDLEAHEGCRGEGLWKTLLKVYPAPPSETLCDFSVLCDAGLAIKSRACTLRAQ